MTLCIGALCDGTRKIVAVADSKLSFGDYSTEANLKKLEPLMPNWWTMFSGDDIRLLPFIIRAARRKFTAFNEPADEYWVSRALHMAAIDSHVAQIESQVLNQWSISLRQFRRAGRRQFSEELYAKLTNRIERVESPLEFLLLGFDPQGFGHIIGVTAKHGPECWNKLGWAAIGSGYVPAEAALTFHHDREQFGIGDTEESCIQCCCSAKFMSESADAVGHKNTFVAVLQNDGTAKTLPINAVTEIKRMWERQAALRVVNEIGEHIRSQEWEPLSPATPPVPKSAKRGRSRQRPSRA